MAEIITLGPVGFNATGEYDSTKKYNRLDLVLYENISYCAKQTVQGVSPTNSEYWDRLGISAVDIANYYTKSETDTLINGKEDSTNKVTILGASSTDEQYPSAKCVYEIIGNLESILETLDTGSGV